MVTVQPVTTLNELLKQIEDRIDGALGPRWFRGVGNHVDHKLTPSLLRHPDVINGTQNPIELEDRLEAKFQQTSPPFLQNQPQSKFDWLFLQQHFGVPTRLLDWSENPFIALYFALSSSSAGKTPCLWTLDPLAWTKKSLNNPNLPRIPDPKDNAAALFLDGLKDPLAPRTDPIAIYANHSNSRIVAQRGAFTIFGVGKTPMEEIAYAEDCLHCYTIEESLKQTLFKKLNSIGYTHSVVYPDLSGLGAEMKTLFGF